MSYDIYLADKNGDTFSLDEPLEEGGTYVLGGSTETHLNVTYNYSWYYYKYINNKDGIRYLYGKSGKDCIKILEKAIKPFKDDIPRKDYWDGSSRGNCVKPLKIFLDWCNKYPSGIFHGD